MIDASESIIEETDLYPGGLKHSLKGYNQLPLSVEWDAPEKFFIDKRRPLEEIEEGLEEDVGKLGGLRVEMRRHSIKQLWKDMFEAIELELRIQTARFEFLIVEESRISYLF